MYFAGTHMCPVKTYDLYTSRLDPRQPRLWQTPKIGVSWNDEIWYTVQPMGKTKIQDLMPTLYQEARLSKRYTNHCICATTVNILGRQFATRKVMRWTGHKSEDSIKSYAHKTSKEEKKEMSGCLDTAILGPPPKKQKPNEPVNQKPQIPVAVENAQDQSSGEELSLRELLELTPEQEQNLLKELFSTEMEIPNNVVANVNQNNTNNVVQPLNQVAPKMMFQNSTITTNFNVNK